MRRLLAAIADDLWSTAFDGAVVFALAVAIFAAVAL